MIKPQITLRTPTKVELILLLIIVFLLLYTCSREDKGVVVKTETTTDTIYRPLDPIDITVVSSPVNMQPDILVIPPKIDIIQGVKVVTEEGKTVETNKYTYKDTISDGVVESTIWADNIYKRVLNYKSNPTQMVINNTETITKFDNRFMIGTYTLFDNTGSLFSMSDYRWSGTGLEILHIRQKVYYGLGAGIGKSYINTSYVGGMDLDFDWEENGLQIGGSSGGYYTTVPITTSELNPEIKLSFGVKF